MSMTADEAQKAFGCGPLTHVTKTPLGKRIKWGILTFVLRDLVFGSLLFLLGLKERFFPSKNAPSVVKTYSCRRQLPVRIFYPPGYVPSAGQKYPTLFTIHGGGFMLGSPRDTDEWNTIFASKFNALVVALNYRKAPAHPWPQQHEDIQALFNAAFADEMLPIDTARVALAGWSAGGNLTAVCSQLPSIRNRIGAAIPIYPSLDWTLDAQAKGRLQRQKPAFGTARDSAMLLRLGPVFAWAYRPVGHDLRDPLLCPYFASREALPPHLFIIGCELDPLGHEAWRFANRLSDGRRIPELDEPVGQEMPGKHGELILDDERFHWEDRASDGRSSVKWLLVPDAIHGFDSPVKDLKDKELREDCNLKMEQMIQIIGDWLFAGPWKETVTSSEARLVDI